MAGELRIELLGGFGVAVDDTRVAERAWRLRKARSLVKLLALAPRHTLHREQVCELLWPDRDMASAAGNLRQTLHVARRAIGGLGIDAGVALGSDGDLIALSATAEGLIVDLDEFERGAHDALNSPTIDKLRDAAARYRGELLPEDRYEPWTIARRDGAREQYLLLIVELARQLEDRDDAPGAIAALQLAVAGDPLHEPAQRALMRLYAGSGRRQRALAQYQALRETLRLELADEPEPETRELYRSILTREPGPAPATAPGPENATTAATATAPGPENATTAATATAPGPENATAAATAAAAGSENATAAATAAVPGPENATAAATEAAAGPETAAPTAPGARTSPTPAPNADTATEAIDDIPAAALRRGPRGGRAIGNLPVSLTSFVGREQQIDEVAALLRRTRLLTLTGTGGAGKTRLALEVAGVAAAQYPDGVWLAELAPVSDDDAVTAALAAAIGADTRGSRPVRDSLLASIGDRQMLVVLDNCEQVVGACARLAHELLSSCPRLAILATSREALRTAGEVQWRVPPLSLAHAGDPPRQAAQTGSVALFCERAAAVSPSFALTEENVAAVIDVCRRVDGIPLALELAAARTSMLSVAEIAERLGESLAVLSAGPRTAGARQQTLTGMLDWSHELLDDRERCLFRRMAVFAGSCTLDSIEDVCAGGVLERDGVLDVAGRLVAKSLVVVDEGAGASRLRLLEPIRQYASSRLAASDEESDVHARHRRHYLTVAQNAERALLAADPGPALARLELDHDDLHAALRDALHADPTLALALVAAQWRSWFASGRLIDGEGWVASALDANPEPSALRARVLLARSVLAGRRGMPPLAYASAEAALAVAEQIGDEDLVAQSLLHVAVLGWAYSNLDPLAEGRLARAQALALRQHDEALATAVLGVSAAVAWSRGRLGDADELFEHSIAGLEGLDPATPCFVPIALGLVLEHRAGSPPRLHNEDTLSPWRHVRADQAVAFMLVNRAAVARWCGDLDVAAATLEDALARARDLRDAAATSLVLLHLGATLRDRGDLDTARELMQESLAIREERRDASGVGLTRNALALAHSRAGDHATALALLERSQSEFTAAGDAVGATATLADIGYVALDAGDLEQARATLERALGLATDVFHWLTGAAWLALALAGEAHAAGDAQRERAMIDTARSHFATNADVLGAAACDDAAARVGVAI
jgi:predicted ATPase/DNA-binding SARP family transcriptional activator